MKLAEGKHTSHLPQLFFALAFHILAAGVDILVARGDPPLQGRRPSAIRAASQRNWTEARPFIVRGGSRARGHTAGVDARTRRRRRGMRATVGKLPSGDGGSGTGVRWFCSFAYDVEKRWVPRGGAPVGQVLMWISGGPTTLT